MAKIRDKIINYHSSSIPDKETLKRSIVDISDDEKKLRDGEIAVIMTNGAEGIYTLNHDKTDLIEYSPISHTEKKQILDFVNQGGTDEVIITETDDTTPSANEKIWISFDGDATTSGETTVPPTARFIELNEIVTSLNNDSASNNIEAAFNNADYFNEIAGYLAQNTKLITGIIINNDTNGGKAPVTLSASKATGTTKTINVEYVLDGKYVKLVVTNNNGTFSCTREEIVLGESAYIFNDPQLEHDLVPEADYNELKAAIEVGKVIIYNMSDDTTTDYVVLSNASYDDTNGITFSFATNNGQLCIVKIGTNRTITTSCEDIQTNVLILDYATDLANGVSGQTIDASVSAKLNDAIDKGKACVVKAENSDILANLQKTGNNVSVVMEQVSNLSGKFIATNTTITVNTSNNTISNVATGALDFSDYATKAYVDEKVSAVDLSDYATKTYVDEKAVANQIPMTGYVVATGISEEQLTIQETDTVAVALGKLQKQSLDNEDVIASALNKINSSCGLSINAEYVPKASNIASATTIADAIEILAGLIANGGGGTQSAAVFQEAPVTVSAIGTEATATIDSATTVVNVPLTISGETGTTPTANIQLSLNNGTANDTRAVALDNGSIVRVKTAVANNTVTVNTNYATRIITSGEYQALGDVTATDNVTYFVK